MTPRALENAINRKQALELEIARIDQFIADFRAFDAMEAPADSQVTTDIPNNSGADDASEPDLVTTPDTGDHGDAPVTPRKTKKQMVKECHEEHPDWTYQQIARKLNLTPGSVSGHLTALGIRLKDVHAQLEAENAQEVLEARRSAPKAQPAPTPSKSAGIAIQTKPMTKLKGKRVYLRDLSAGPNHGKYLHQSGTCLTEERAYAWIGSPDKVEACRAKFPKAEELSQVEVME